MRLFSGGKRIVRGLGMERKEKNGEKAHELILFCRERTSIVQHPEQREQVVTGICR